MTSEKEKFNMDRALDSLQEELDLLLGLSQDLTVKVRTSQETVAKLKRISDEFRNFRSRGD
jgi:hypothetical protein